MLMAIIARACSTARHDRVVIVLREDAAELVKMFDV
jgi:hypothetical protein